MPHNSNDPRYNDVDCNDRGHEVDCDCPECMPEGCMDDGCPLGCDCADCTPEMPEPEPGAPSAHAAAWFLCPAAQHAAGRSF